VRFKRARVPVVSLYSTSVTTLEFYTCEFEGTELDWQNFLLWIRQSMRICKLSLCLFHNSDAPPFYRSLAHNMHVKELEISVRVDLPDVVSEALQNLLENTTSIVALTVYNTMSEGLVPILKGLPFAMSVIDVTFEDCLFDEVLFNTMVQTKPCIRSLCLRKCRYFGSVPSELIQLLQRQELQIFEVTCAYFFEYDMWPSEFLRDLLVAVENSNLDSFSIGCIQDESMIQELLCSIPKMAIKTLRIHVLDSRNLNLESFKSQILLAFRKNATIRTVECKKQSHSEYNPVLTFENLFTWEDRQHLNYYAARNKGIEDWISSPFSVPRGAWPKVLAEACNTGPCTVYGILSVLGTALFTDSEVHMPCAAKKRKRVRCTANFDT
jgi:hypothetical protein